MSDQITPMGKFFDSVAEDYDVVQTSNIDRGEEYYRELSTPLRHSDLEQKLLSLGAGTGLDLVSIFQKLPHVQIDAVDVSEGLLAKLKLRFEEKQKQISLIVANYYELEVPSNEYDIVLASATLHHFTHKEKSELLEKVGDWLRPGGRIIVGDFYVDDAVSQLFRDHYDSFLEAGRDVSYGRYHLDIPTTVEEDCQLLVQLGFNGVQTIWSSQNYAIISGTKSDGT